MRPVENSIFKWIYHLKTSDKQRLKETIKRKIVNKVEEPEPEKKLLEIVNNSYKKFKDWIRKGKYDEQDFVRHTNKISRDLYDENTVSFSEDLAKLQEILELSLINEQLDDNKIYKHRILFEKAKDLDFPEAFFYHLEKWQQNNNKSIYRSSEFYYNNYLISNFRYFHPKFGKDKTQIEINKVTYSPKVEIEKSWLNLLKSNLLSQIKLACELRTRAAVFDDSFSHFSQHNIQYLIEQIKTFDFNDFIEGYIYLELFRCLDFKNLLNIEDFESSKSLILANLNRLSLEEKDAILINLMNVAFAMCNKGISQSKYLCYQIVIFGFDNVWLTGTSVDISLLLNIYDLTHIHSPELANEIIEKYTSKFTLEEKKWVSQFLEGRMLFRKGKFKKALEFIEELQHHKKYGLTIRKYVLILECKYELNLELINTKTYNPILSEIADKNAVLQTAANFKNYVNKSQYFNQLSVYEKNCIFNFIAITNLLVDKKSPIDKIKHKLKSSNTLSSEWLEEKLKTYVTDK